MRRAIKLLVLLCSLSAAINMMAQTTVHNVRPGDTFESVAARYGVAVEALIQANPYTQKCYVGAQLMIPSVEKSVPAKNNDKQTSGATISLEKKVQPVASNTVAKKPVTPTAVKNEDQPLDPYQLMYDGVALMKKGKYSKAKKLFSKALKIKNLPEAHYYRGLCNYRNYKWKPAYKDFAIAKRSSSLDKKMKADAEDLYKYTYAKYKEKVETRREAWAKVGKAVGTTLLAIGAVAVETMAASTGYGYGYGSGYGTASSFYSPAAGTGSVMPSGVSSMSTAQFNSYLDTQLTDLFYITAMQVEQKNRNEYMQATNGGQLMSYDQWMNMKTQSAVSTSYDTSTSSSGTTLDELEESRRDVLNRTAGEVCQHCKGTGKCPACNGTKVASGFGNTYKCTVCNENGDCPVCHGTKVTSWNR